jgi:DNA-binding LacI/PurR family transcriptional regulator
MAVRQVTIKDIAREAGVSPSLVSFVMSKSVAWEQRCRDNLETE